jgi:hypothetical protein
LSYTLWPLLADILTTAEAELGLELCAPASWNYGDLCVKLGQPGLTSGFVGTLIYEATKRDLMRRGTPGYYDFPPGQSGPRVSYETREDHVWAGIWITDEALQSDSLLYIPGMPTLPFQRNGGLRHHLVPIALCDGTQSSLIQQVHTRLVKQLGEDKRVITLVEQWADIHQWWQNRVEAMDALDPSELFDPACPVCIGTP